MKLKELIEELQKLDPELSVTIKYQSFNLRTETETIDHWSELYDVDERNNKIRFNNEVGRL